MADKESKEKAKAFAAQSRDIRKADTQIEIRSNGIPAEKMIKDHLFLLKYTFNNKNTANKEAMKFHKQGYHTRVIETSTGMFSVYRRASPTARARRWPTGSFFVG